MLGSLLKSRFVLGNFVETSSQPRQIRSGGIFLLTCCVSYAMGMTSLPFTYWEIDASHPALGCQLFLVSLIRACRFLRSLTGAWICFLYLTNTISNFARWYGGPFGGLEMTNCGMASRMDLISSLPEQLAGG